MLSPADAALVGRDPAQPGLALLLDPDRVEGLLHELLPGPVQRRYLRYKPGTSCVLAVRVGGRDLALTVTTEAAAPKTVKTARRAPDGAVLHHDAGLGLLVTTPAADRDLPALARLHRLPSRVGLSREPVEVLAWKPARRLVARVGDHLLRVYRPGQVPPLPDGLPGTAEETYADDQLRVLRWVPGAALGPRSDPATVAAAGAALARLHRTPVGTVAPGDPAAELQAVAAQVAVLLPALGPTAHRLASDLGRRLADDPAGAVLAHGDFSCDQVVSGPGSVTLIDLDRLRAAPAAHDLGSWRAVTLMSGGAPTGDLEQGYGDVAPLPEPGAVALHTAAHLLRRAVDPFRTVQPDWDTRVATALALAADQAGVSA